MRPQTADKNQNCNKTRLRELIGTEMKITEIREFTTEELVKRIAEEENNLTDLRFSLALKQLDNTAKVTHTRKTIARLKTELNARYAAAKKSGTAVK